MKLVIKQDFSYFHRGHDRVDYKSGDVIETDDEEMAEVAIDQGWATKADKPATNAAHRSARANKKAKE